MLIDFKTLFPKYDIKCDGMLHVGASEGQERHCYKELGIQPVYWVEADEDTYKVLVRNLGKFQHHDAIRAVLSERAGDVVDFFVANNGQSSSLLNLGTHKKEHPDVFYTRTVKHVTETVDGLLEEGRIRQCNFVNIDVQGAELMVLKGATKYLENVDYLYLEVNKRELYKGCALIGDLDAYLTDFSRVETEWTRHSWGDALWIRSSLL